MMVGYKFYVASEHSKHNGEICFHRFVQKKSFMTTTVKEGRNYVIFHRVTVKYNVN